jgi:hypothetical protein
MHTSRRAGGLLRHVGLLSSLLVAGCGSARAGGTIFTEAEYMAFCDDGRIAPTDAEARAVFGPWSGVVTGREGIPLARIRVLDDAALGAVLDEAIAGGFGALAAFTEPVFRRPDGCAIAVGVDTLRDIDGRYDFHSLFRVRAPLASGTGALRM